MWLAESSDHYLVSTQPVSLQEPSNSLQFNQKPPSIRDYSPSQEQKQDLIHNSQPAWVNPLEA